MNVIHAFNVIPALPERLRPLREIAYNLHWVWDHESINLFRRIQRDLWESCTHNPIMMLNKTSQERLQSLAEDEAFCAHLDRIVDL